MHIQQKVDLSCKDIQFKHYALLTELYVSFEIRL